MNNPLLASNNLAWQLGDKLKAENQSSQLRDKGFCVLWMGGAGDFIGTEVFGHLAGVCPSSITHFCLHIHLELSHAAKRSRVF